MSKELEALGRLASFHRKCEFISTQTKDDFNLVGQALERNEPMKPMLDENNNHRCARCHHIVDNHYCSDCGGAVDWGKEMLKEKLELHIKMLIDAFNYNLNNSGEYSIAYNNFLRTEIEMLEKILDETK